MGLLHLKLIGIAKQLNTTELYAFNPAGWKPAINAYRCKRSIRICVDLAGVEPSGIDVQVKPRCLILRGRRQAPEPGGEDRIPLRVLALEIDSGTFERTIALEAEVDPELVSTERSNGLLWICLPLRSQA